MGAVIFSFSIFIIYDIIQLVRNHGSMMENTVYGRGYAAV